MDTHIIIGEDVDAGAVCMVSPAMLLRIVGDAWGQRLRESRVLIADISQGGVVLASQMVWIDLQHVRLCCGHRLVCHCRHSLWRERSQLEDRAGEKQGGLSRAGGGALSASYVYPQSAQLAGVFARGLAVIARSIEHIRKAGCGLRRGEARSSQPLSNGRQLHLSVMFIYKALYW